MPAVAPVDRLRILSCRRLPFEWPPGRRSRIRGITLWRRVYLLDRCCPVDGCDFPAVELLLHELVHVEQFRRNPLRFPLRYLRDLVRFGYLQHPAEIEARQRAAALITAYRSDDPCRCSASIERDR